MLWSCPDLPMVSWIPSSVRATFSRTVLRRFLRSSSAFLRQDFWLLMKLIAQFLKISENCRSFLPIEITTVPIAWSAEISASC